MKRMTVAAWLRFRLNELTKLQKQEADEQASDLAKDDKFSENNNKDIDDITYLINCLRLKEIVRNGFVWKDVSEFADTYECSNHHFVLKVSHTSKSAWLYAVFNKENKIAYDTAASKDEAMLRAESAVYGTLLKRN